LIIAEKLLLFKMDGGRQRLRIGLVRGILRACLTPACPVGRAGRDFTRRSSPTTSKTGTF